MSETESGVSLQEDGTWPPRDGLNTVISTSRGPKRQTDTQIACIQARLEASSRTRPPRPFAHTYRDAAELLEALLELLVAYVRAQATHKDLSRLRSEQ